MKKIFFGGLGLEITRRCQLQCAHCLRGDAQNVDMSKEIIDSILDQCAGIFEVSFMGGEPTLNIDVMDYFLGEVHRRNILLGQLSFVTNGISIPDTLKDFLLRSYDYISSCLCYLRISVHDPCMRYQPVFWEIHQERELRRHLLYSSLYPP